ncbi:septin-4-like isoform X14 [Phycodurus eques]|uniref:septin-4-like isoform X14 n=1 Tax=Phycodurus eques TaxID=693459 RepID=UPI002ACD606F|nr:septin-4-like isoform X14 [Phycodurus eques]
MSEEEKRPCESVPSCRAQRAAGEMRAELGRDGLPTSRLHASPRKERTDGQTASRSGHDRTKLSSLRVTDEDGVRFPFAGVAPPPASPSSPSPAAAPRVPLRPGRGGSDSSFPPARRTPVSQRSLDSPLGPASRPRSPRGCFDPYDSPEDRDKEYVGFAALPNQVHRKAVKKGFAFTPMVAGESGLGKSTLINGLFLTDLYKDRKIPNAEERIRQTVSTVKRTVSIEEKGVKLRLSVVDTPGFGDAVDDTRSWKHLEDYVEQQFHRFFRDESGLDRGNIRDNRVHCCLYFISPHGHGSARSCVASGSTSTASPAATRTTTTTTSRGATGCSSGECGPLGLPASAGHAGEDAHAGPEGRDPREPLRELPSALHPQHDAHGRAGPQAQFACEVPRRKRRGRPSAAGRLRRGQGSTRLGERPGAQGDDAGGDAERPRVRPRQHRRGNNVPVSVGFLFAHASACPPCHFELHLFVIHCHCFYCHLVADDNQEQSNKNC